MGRVSFAADSRPIGGTFNEKFKTTASTLDNSVLQKPTRRAKSVCISLFFWVADYVSGNHHTA